MKNLLGVDIGGTKCAVIFGRLSEKSSKGDEIDIQDKAKFSTELQKGYLYTLEKISEAIKDMLNRNSLDIKEIDGIGISCGGPLDSKRGIILSPPNLIGWDNVPVLEFFKNRFGIETRLQNDANACALAEWKFGAARGYKNIVLLTFGTGMGAGIILDGRLYSGTNDMAGEIGHIRLSENGPVGYGKAGSFEGFCSGGGIAQLAYIKTLERQQLGEKAELFTAVGKSGALDAKTLGDAADAGDTLASEIYRISGHYLGIGISILIDILNPEIIVIGSIFSRSQNLLWPEAKKVIEQESLRHSRSVCSVVPAGLREHIGDYAALTIALGEY